MSQHPIQVSKISNPSPYPISLSLPHIPLLAQNPPNPSPCPKSLFSLPHIPLLAPNPPYPSPCPKSPISLSLPQIPQIPLLAPNPPYPSPCPKSPISLSLPQIPQIPLLAQNLSSAYPTSLFSLPHISPQLTPYLSSAYPKVYWSQVFLFSIPKSLHKTSKTQRQFSLTSKWIGLVHVCAIPVSYGYKQHQPTSTILLIEYQPVLSILSSYYPISSSYYAISVSYSSNLWPIWARYFRY